MTNPLDYTLSALGNIQDAIDEIKVRKSITTNQGQLQDYDKIITQLEDSASKLINVVVAFQKFEKSQ